MKKIVYICSLALFLSSCSNGSNSTSNSITSTSISPVEKTIQEKFEAYLAKFDDLSYDANKITYKQTQVNNYSAIDMITTREGVGKQYSGDFYREEFQEKINDTDQYSGVIEKGVNGDKYYAIYYYGEGESNNNIEEYNKGTTKFEEFSICTYKGYYLNSVLLYSYDNYLANKDNDRYTKFTLTCDSNDVDFKTDGEKKLDLVYRIFSGSTIVNTLESTDTIVIDNGKVISSHSECQLSSMNSINYTKFVKIATYEYDSSIGEYTGTKLNPSDFSSKTQQ